MSDQTEVHRLRAALVEIKQLLNEDRENDGAFQSWNHMQAWKVATQALSSAFDVDDNKIQHLRSALNQLIEDYKRRIRSAITMIDDPEVRVEQKTRIQVKKAAYQAFINEIEEIMNDEALSITKTVRCGED